MYRQNSKKTTEKELEVKETFSRKNWTMKEKHEKEKDEGSFEQVTQHVKKNGPKIDPKHAKAVKEFCEKKRRHRIASRSCNRGNYAGFKPVFKTQKELDDFCREFQDAVSEDIREMRKVRDEAMSNSRFVHLD